MKRYLLFTGITLSLLANQACATSENQNNATASKVSVADQSINPEKQVEAASPSSEQKKDVNDFVPKGYIVTERVYGDLNKDGTEDCILVIKATDKSKIIIEDQEKLDRNRRGLIALFKKNDQYTLAVKNYQCFSSDNENGGIYYAPELSVVINKGNVYIRYEHGRYGYWAYTFRYQNADLELIGYDASENQGPVVNSETSINFSTQKKITKTNTNNNAEGGDEVFVERTTKIKKSKLIRFSEIKDFDVLDIAQD